MTATVTKVPRFCKNQTVRFVGGTGKIRNYMLGSGSWNYLVEMEMGPEPEMGRVGHETKIWLFEADLALEDNVSYGLASAQMQRLHALKLSATERSARNRHRQVIVAPG